MKGIGTTGLPGSGKSVFSQIAKEQGIPVFRMGRCVIEKVEERGLEVTSRNIGKIAEELREKHGKGVVADLTVDKVETLTSKLVVIDGVRSLAEVKVFKEFFDNFLIVATFAPTSIRHKRILERNREGNISSKEEIEKRDTRELDFGVGKVMAFADEMLVNQHKTYEKFKQECRTLIKKLKDDGL